MNASELIEPFERMLEDIAAPAAVRAAEQEGAITEIWAGFSASGFLDALVPESAGGAGLTPADIAPLLQALGRFAVPAPVGETMIARLLLAQAGCDVPHGPIALACAQAGQRVRVPFGWHAEHVLVDMGNRLMLLGAGDASPTPTGVRADSSAWMQWDDAPTGIELDRPADGLRPFGATVRAALIAGAAARLLDMTVTYANERIQFGKPIGRQQALQQQLAVMAQDAVAARIAVEMAFEGGLPPRLALAATAKSVAGAAAVRIAATAHAVHGAIGISEEHDLQLYTRYLHDARLADGSEAYWNAILGGLRLTSEANSIDWIREQTADAG